MLPGEAPQGPEEAPAQRDWAGLPQDLLAAILRHPTARAHQSVRLVCRRLRDAFDDGVNRATLRLQPLLLRGERALPPAPACARVVTLDGSGLSHRLMHDWAPAELFDALAAWPVVAPLELDLSGNWDMLHEDGTMERFAGMLSSPGFASGGLQVLNLRACVFGREEMAVLIAALPAAPQLSALRDLNFLTANGGPQDAAMLCAALTAATQLRGLTQLDLSVGRTVQHSDVVGHALAACLCSGRHLSTVQHLDLSDTNVTGNGAAALAAAVVETGLQLKTLDLGCNRIGDRGAMAWASALAASTCLAGLEVLDLRDNGITEQGMAAFTAAHATSLRKLALHPNACDPAGFMQLLAAAPHLAASLERLDLSGCNIGSRAAIDAVAAPLLAGLQLPRLTSLDLSRNWSGKDADALQGLCELLRAATQLSGLTELDLSDNSFHNSFVFAELLVALSAATHLANLRRLSFYEADTGTDQSWPEAWARLMYAAPHLRGLTALIYDEPVPCEERLTALRVQLELMPGIRKLHLRTCLEGEEQLGRLLAALRCAPCLPELRDLSLQLCLEDGEDVHALGGAGVPAWLSSCTQLTGLHGLELDMYASKVAGYEAVGEALAAARHLCGLRELRLRVGAADPIEACKRLWRHLAAPHLQGVAVHVVQW